VVEGRERGRGRECDGGQDNRVPWREEILSISGEYTGKNREANRIWGIVYN